MTDEQILHDMTRVASALSCRAEFLPREARDRLAIQMTQEELDAVCRCLEMRRDPRYTITTFMGLRVLIVSRVGQV